MSPTYNLDWLIIATLAVSSLAGIVATITFVWLVAYKISANSRTND